MGKRTHVFQQALHEFPEKPNDSQSICKARGSRGSNIIEVERPDGKTTLCLLPAKFHKKIWIRRGSFVIVESNEAVEDERITGQIVRVLMKDDIKYLQSLEGVWPQRFQDDAALSDEFARRVNLCQHENQEKEEENTDVRGTRSGTCSDGSSSDDDLPPLEKIRNRKIIQYTVSSSDSDSE